MEHLPDLWFIIEDLDDLKCTYRAYNADKTLMTVWYRTMNNLLDNTDELLTYDECCLEIYTQLQNTVIINSILCTIEQAQEAYPDFITKADLPEPVLISSLIPDKQRTTSTKLASHIFKPTWISSSGTSLGENINIDEVTDTIYYYKEPPPDLSAITKALHILGIKLLIAPKKIHTLISTNPLFVECDDSIISSLLQTKTINYFSQDFEEIRSYFPCQYTKYKSAQYDFVKIHDEIYHKSLANNLYCSATVASALKHFQFTPTELTYPITWSDIENTYPLLNNFRYNQERGQYYINLEDQAHALRSTSGLNRPTLPDS